MATFTTALARYRTHLRDRGRWRRLHPRHFLESFAKWLGIVALAITMIPTLIWAAAGFFFLLPFFFPFLFATTHGEVFNEPPHEPPDEADWLKPWPGPAEASSTAQGTSSTPARTESG